MPCNYSPFSQAPLGGSPRRPPCNLHCYGEDIPALLRGEVTPIDSPILAPRRAASSGLGASGRLITSAKPSAPPPARFHAFANCFTNAACDSRQNNLVGMHNRHVAPIHLRPQQGGVRDIFECTKKQPFPNPTPPPKQLAGEECRWDFYYRKQLVGAYYREEKRRGEGGGCYQVSGCERLLLACELALVSFRSYRQLS